jgi:hypothetical protein
MVRMVMGLNRYYKLFTKQEIPNDEERRAVNCYYATLVPCNEKFARKCRQESYRLWRNCPKQTGKRYKGEGNEK